MAEPKGGQELDVELSDAEGEEAEPREIIVEAPRPTNPEAPTAIVGIGASAGGLEALSALFKAMPDDTGLGFVIIQHLDPRHESQMASLLGRVTKMRVMEAEDGIMVKGNTVYVIPPDQLISLNDGHFRFTPRPPGPGHQGAIDQFLNSLADEMRDRAMAVILSGTLSDGRDGLVAVRRSDGFTFAQDLDSAGYPEMPRNAIRTGFVDFILSPDKMAKHIARLAQHFQHPVDGVADHGETERRRLIRLVLQATGVDLSQYKQETLDRRIQRRVLMTQCKDLKEYLEYIGNNKDEIHKLYEDALIHVTGFFRDPDVYDAIRERVLKPLLLDRQNKEPLRLWVAGCSTGEEPYSLAMMIDMFQRDHNLRIPINIFATDISEPTISKARLGMFSAKDLEPVPMRMRKEYFAQSQGGFQIAKHIRSMVIFAVHDITSDPPFSSMDLVVCRNLLIYLQPAAQRQAIGVLHYALRASGFLVLGSAETPGRELAGFRETDAHNRIYEKRQGTASPSLRLRTPFRRPGIPEGDRVLTEAPRGDEADVVRVADRQLLDGLVRASVIIDRQYRIVSVRGESDRFLRLGHGTGEPTLLRVLRGGAADIRRGVEAIWRRGKPKPLDVTFIHENGQDVRGIVHIFPVGHDASHAIIAFREPMLVEHATPLPKDSASVMDVLFGGVRHENRILRHRVAEAEARLDAVVEDYETTLEELRAANEEAMSTNEELQSTNEELQTATEESQSTTEELRTLNDELVHRNAEIQKVNDDMMNIMNIVDMPLILIDNKMRITRYTRGAEHLFGLSDDHVGQMVSVARGPRGVDLVELVQKVMRSLQRRNAEAKDPDGNPWDIQVHPYRTAENRIDGAIILGQRVQPDE